MRVAYRLMPLIVLTLATVAFGASARVTNRVIVVIQEQQALVQQGSDMLLKVRLAPGVSARVWVDVSCDTPNEGARIITQSGSYVLPIASSQDGGNSYCMVSSDGQLRAAVPIR